MPTLHIEHAITDFPTWSEAFNRFADVRRRAGVRACRLQRPIGDEKFVVLDLEFATSDEADAFLHFLTTQVWASEGNAPALVGSPQAKVLELVAHC